MRNSLSWKWKAISAFIVITYCQALNQEIGEKCTNKNGVVGLCQLKYDCSGDNYLGAVCNSEQTIVCCAKNILKYDKPFNSSNGPKEDKSLETRFGFLPDFFHAPILPQNPIPNTNFFYNQNPNPNFVGNVLNQNLNTMQFLENRPYQNFEQDLVTTSNLNENNNNYGSSISRPNQNPNYINNRPNHERYTENQNNNNYLSSTTQRPNQNQNHNNNRPNYERYTENQNNNNPSSISQKLNQNQNHNNNRPNYERYTENQNNNNPSSIPQRPNQNQNHNNNRPNYERYTENQNNNYLSSTSQRPNQNQNHNNNRPNYERYTENQNNNNNPSSIPQRPNQNQNHNNNRPNYEGYTENQNNNKYPISTSQRPNHHENTNQSYQEMSQSNEYSNKNNGKRQNNNNSGNYQYNHQLSNIQPNPRPNYNNYRPSSSIYFPDDDFTTRKPETTFPPTTNNYYGYQNMPNKNTKRINEIKCEEYSKALITTISVLPLSIDGATKPVPIETCDSTGVELIVGGTKAELGEFPHMAAVEFSSIIGNQWNCGGTLISERFVLTAAHCTISTQGDPVRVRLGDLNLQSTDDEANPIDITISEVIVHPDYVKTSRYNDIALLRLEKKVKFNNHIRPACLYNSNNIYSPKATATGWGSVAFGDHSSDELLKVDLDIIDNRQCDKLYEDQKKVLNRGIINSMICAGDLAGGHDTCLGDSGGPLVIRSEKNACVFNLIGITSFGKTCAAENSAGVYTRVSAYIPWIEKIVWP